MDRHIIPLDSIRIDGDTQIRAAIDMDVVSEYAAQIARMPPISVYFDGRHHWLADGFHRYHAAHKAQVSMIEADVHKGTVEDARWFAAGANKQHGLRRTNKDKLNAVTQALAMRPELSDRAIAEHVGVSHNMVSEYRARLSPDDSPRLRSGRDGRVIDTSNIGKPVAAPTTDQPATGETALKQTEDGDACPPRSPAPPEPRPSSRLDRHPVIKALLKRLYDLSCYRDEQLSALAVREIAKQLTQELSKVL